MDIWQHSYSAYDPIPVGRPLLVLSGIRGDVEALDAVLATTMADHDVAGVLVIGDHCFGGPDPFATWGRLQQLGATLVRGDLDHVLGLREDDPVIMAASAPWRASWLRTREALGEVLVRRVSNLPTTAVASLDSGVAGLMAVNRSPFRPWDSSTGKMLPETVIGETACVAEDVLVMACSTEPFIQQMEEVLVVNCASVGRFHPSNSKNNEFSHAVLIQEFSDGRVRGQRQKIVASSTLAGHTCAAQRRVG
jgi:hypothetical protein